MGRCHPSKGTSMTKDEALKLALEALKTIDEAMPFPVAKLAQAAIKEALAQPVPESSACCHACFKASGAILMTRMILCPTCGNKRCPRASDHRLECTDSNEPGQTGSVYTAFLPVQAEQKPWCMKMNDCKTKCEDCPDKPPEERNFCPRCGKRTADSATIHTCTPPRENT